MVETCFLRVNEFGSWWKSVQGNDYRLYTAMGLVLAGIFLSSSFTRIMYWSMYYVSPRKWRWPIELREMALWETTLLVRMGFFWGALAVVRLDNLLCQWPLWIFGVPLLLLLNKIGILLSKLVVRIGMKGHEDEKSFGRKTLLSEGTNIIFNIVWAILAYVIYLAVFEDFGGSTIGVILGGLCFAMAIYLTPVIKNWFGSHYILFGGLVARGSCVKINHNPSGSLSDGTSSYLTLQSQDGTRTMIPSGMILMSLVSELNHSHWPVRLTIKLSPRLRSSVIRRLVQDLEHLLRNSSHAIGMSDQCTAFQQAQQLQAIIDSPDRFVSFPSKSENEIVPRSDYASFVCISGKWRVHIHTFTTAKSQEIHRELVSELILDITRLLEQSYFKGSTNLKPLVNDNYMLL